MSRRTFRTRNGKQLRAAPGRYRQGAISGLTMFGARGAFRDRHKAQPAEPEPEMEEKDDGDE